ncbi:hypothetical protein SCUP515_11391 [Seiridium cupressi]
MSVADLARARSLHEELGLFAEHVRKNTLGTIPIPQVGGKLSALKKDLLNEIDFLQKRLDETQSSNGRSGSNLLFFETLWDAAKRSAELFDIRHRVCTEKLDKPLLAPGRRIIPSLGTHMGSKYRHSLVDLITNDGRVGAPQFLKESKLLILMCQTWVKISTITNRRLLFDLAKEAIFCGDSDDEDGAPGYGVDDDLEIPLLKTVKELAGAARNHCIRTVQPVVHVVLPRIKEKESAEVDKIIILCRQIPGVIVYCNEDLPPAPELTSEAMFRMYPNPKTSFSELLNIDTSVIFALTSEFSHSSVVKQDWFDRQRIAHTEQEEKEHFLIKQVYPIIQGYELVCVQEAVDTYKHIVDTIGTPAERARAKLILGEDPSLSPAQVVEELQKWSIHPVPHNLRLPVRVINVGDFQGNLPSEAKHVLEGQLNPGRSVFSYGWANGLTTVTCNGVATKQLAHGLEKFYERDNTVLDDATWPSMWAFSSSRPLLGVPKAAGWAKRHIGDCETNGCTCGVEKFHGESEVAAQR